MVQPIPDVERLVHWPTARRSAAATGRWAASAGRGSAPVGTEDALAAVADLRLAARAARGHVAEISGLSAPDGPDAVVVDRAGWVSANLTSLSRLLGPVVADLADGRTGSGVAAFAASRATGVEIGAVMGVLSTKVLGQFDPFADPAGGPGRLLLVAPTIVGVERELEVDPRDFRLWVCLHEETHRVQFTANPWLADHLAGEIRALVAGLGGLVSAARGGPDDGPAAEAARRRLTALAAQVRDVVRGKADATDLLGAVQTEDDRARLARLTALMSLLEGHADVVMDDVGPQVVPGVAEIRRRFGRRRAGAGPLDRLLRRLLGLDVKARQYSEGARFVRGVQERAGRDALAQVWRDASTLPRPEEIADPDRWVTRVLG
ncbi:MAG: zinc-dependent metalloprotease [Kineosporiaceae bacterium]